MNAQIVLAPALRYCHVRRSEWHRRPPHRLEATAPRGADPIRIARRDVEDSDTVLHDAGRNEESVDSQQTDMPKPAPFHCVEPVHTPRKVMGKGGKGRDNSLMTNIHGKIPRTLEAQQCGVLVPVELEILRLVDGGFLPVFGGPLDLRASVLAFLVVEVELNE